MKKTNRNKVCNILFPCTAYAAIATRLVLFLIETTLAGVEVYDGVTWTLVGGALVTNQVIIPDGTSTTYTLDKVATAPSILVMFNGVIQIPGSSYSYTVVGNSITFAQAPLSSDIIDIRFLN